LVFGGNGSPGSKVLQGTAKLDSKAKGVSWATTQYRKNKSSSKNKK
jgi:hypothetical protein